MKVQKFEVCLFIFSAIFLIPLYFSRNTIDPGLLPRFIILALFLFFYACIRIFYLIREGFTENHPILIGTLHLFLGGYVLFVIVSAGKAVNGAESLFDICKVMLFAGYILVATRVISQSDEVKMVVVKVVLLTSFLVALLGITEYWGVFQLLDCVKRPVATMGNRNLLSSFLFLGMGFVLFGIWRFNKNWYYLSIITYSAIAYVFLITQTRAVWLACSIGFIGTVALSAFTDRNRTYMFFRYQWKRVVTVVVIGICLAILHQQFRSPSDALPEMDERLASVLDKSLDSNRQRLIMWGKTVQMIRDNFLMGVGVGNWKIIMPKYNLEGYLWQDMTRIPVRPHNDFLWVFAETGMFGFICFGALFILSCFYALRSLKNGKDEIHRSFSVCFLFCCIGYAVISVFDFPNERIEHLVYWGTIISFLLSLNRPFFKEKKVSSKVVLVSLCAVILLSTICLYVGYTRVKGDHHMIKVLQARKAGRWEQLIAETDLINTDMYTMDHTSTPVLWYRGVANFSLNRTDHALNDFTKAYEAHPYHIHVLNNLGSCYEVLRNHSEAEKWYIKALDISPAFYSTIINLSVVYYNIGRYKQAYTTIRQVEECKDPRCSAYLNAIEAKLQEEEEHL